MHETVPDSKLNLVRERREKETLIAKRSKLIGSAKCPAQIVLLQSGRPGGLSDGHGDAIELSISLRSIECRRVRRMNFMRKMKIRKRAEDCCRRQRESDRTQSFGEQSNSFPDEVNK